METKKLMIGNLVYNTVLEGNTSVDALSLNGIRGDINETVYDKSSLYPIPLTDDILNKNGFEYRHKNIASLQEYPFCLEMIEWPNENGIGLWMVGGIFKIRYVHELQNALRLADIDKEITL